MIIITDGEKVNLGDPVALVSDDTVGVLEGVSSYARGINDGKTVLLFRADDDASITECDWNDIRILTAEELSDRNEAIALADAQATFDAAKTALDAAGGDSCDGCV